MLQAAFSYGQLEEEIEMTTDRPDQTESASIVPTGYAQVETGVTFVNDEFSKDGINTDIETWSLTTTLVRLRMARSFDFRIGGEYMRETRTFNDRETHLRGINSISTGAKIKMSEEDRWIPESAFLFELELPIGVEEFRPSEVQPAMRLAMMHTLSDTLSLGYNLGGAWDIDTQNAAFLYTASLGKGLSEKWAMFFELFGNFNSQTDNAHSFDFGGTHIIKSNVQLDVAIEYELNDPAEDWLLLGGYNSPSCPITIIKIFKTLLN